ncbi:hypothetical protein GCM10010193_69640 [Kitasatospora atroaurantiaca]|uniref:Uncharacterized protein n=1 Tax=Kitasatospora atroaurantiaca TaxID=285545 RepID=A0A561ENA1_9ACTN|nr:hypothetical protein [Kitasatospora atroaurantiaca]TWE17049.1 hypothetical protein FB465_2053 [Kitasatospora atroaurantiaca]
MSTADSLFRALDLIEPGDLVSYHGSLTDFHGLYIATPCDCHNCKLRDAYGVSDFRFRLLDPWGDLRHTPRCVRRKSITRATGGR